MSEKSEDGGQNLGHFWLVGTSQFSLVISYIRVFYVKHLFHAFNMAYTSNRTSGAILWLVGHSVFYSFAAHLIYDSIEKLGFFLSMWKFKKKKDYIFPLF